MRGIASRRDILAITVLVFIGIGVPLWFAAAAGAIGVPGLDDWVYMRAANSLLRTGVVDMPVHSAGFLGQLVLVQPLLWLSGGDAWAFTAFGLISSLIGIACTYVLAREFLGTGSAVMAVLLVEAFPGFARESAMFMTDVPAYAFAVLCLLLGTRSLRGEGGRTTLVASLAVGLVAVSIREFAIAAPAAILVAAWARSRAEERVWLIGVSGTLAVGAAGIIVLASMQARVAPETTDHPWSFVVPAFATLAAVLLPAVVLGIGKRMATLSAEQLIVGVVACLVFFLPYGVPVGNIWTARGIGGDLLLSGARELVIGGPAWALSGQLALFSAILVVALAFSWGRRNLAEVVDLSAVVALALRIARKREAPIVVFLIAYSMELVIYTPFGPVLDRYLYPMVPAAAILLLSGSAGPFHFSRSAAFAHASFAWLAVSAFLMAANSFAYDTARWRAGEAAVALGYDARTVDAGYEWVGYHPSGAETTGGSRGRLWYYQFWPSFQPCAILSNSPLDAKSPEDGRDFRLIREDRSAYLQYFFFGPAEPLYLYGALADDCPPPPAARTVP